MRHLQGTPTGISLEAEVGVTYYLFVHGENPSLVLQDTGGLGKFELYVSDPEISSLPVGDDVKASASVNGTSIVDFDGTAESILRKPTNGTAIVQDDGDVLYTPDPGFVGEDEFDVMTCNEDGNCTRATVTVQVANHVDVENGHVGNVQNGSKDSPSPDESSWNKNYLYTLLALLLLPVIWCCCRPFGDKNDLRGNWDPTQPAGMSSKNLGETPFYDEDDSVEGEPEAESDENPDDADEDSDDELEEEDDDDEEEDDDDSDDDESDEDEEDAADVNESIV
jgi:hypothetical protein